MDNPFAGLKTRRGSDAPAVSTAAQERSMSDELRKQKKALIYETYSPLVSEVLDDLISACMPGLWRQGSDCSGEYCCRINWYAGPEETHKDPYDQHHDIRRKIEVTLEQDSLCNPTGFTIINHENLHHSAHVGLSREELVRGIQQVIE